MAKRVVHANDTIETEDRDMLLGRVGPTRGAANGGCRRRRVSSGLGSEATPSRHLWARSWPRLAQNGLPPSLVLGFRTNLRVKHGHGFQRRTEASATAGHTRCWKVGLDRRTDRGTSGGKEHPFRLGGQTASGYCPRRSYLPEKVSFLYPERNQRKGGARECSSPFAPPPHPGSAPPAGL